MTKKKKDLCIFLFFISIALLFMKHINIVIPSVIKSSNIFFYKVFPSLFLFFILIEFFISYDSLKFIVNILYKPLNKLFKISKSGIFVIITSIVSGLPSNAKVIKSLLDRNEISISEANKVILYTFFPNPMFVIGTIGIILFNNKIIGIKLLFINYLVNFIIGLLIRNYPIVEKNLINKKNQNKFSSVLKTGINSSFDTLLLILGNITIFITLSNILSIYLPFNSLFNNIILSILEMTSGITSINEIDIILKLKILIINASLSFSGISVILQASSILSDYEINIKKIIKFRILSLILNLIITYFIF